MRRFNKLFVVSLPRCATVSMSQALGMLGVPTAHLGKIYHSATAGNGQHHDSPRLTRLFHQVRNGDFDLEVFRECQALADYPACCLPVLVKLRELYPESLFINVRRNRSLERWLQSVEQQFIGLELIAARQETTPVQQAFVEILRYFRELTFGHADFAAGAYRRAYQDYQAALQSLQSSDGPSTWLQFEDAAELARFGFPRLADFLQIHCPQEPFPGCDEHSREPEQAFREALRAGTVVSQTDNLSADDSSAAPN